LAGAISAEYSSEMPCSRTSFSSRDEVFAGLALSYADGREWSAIGLADIENVDGAEAENSGFFFGRVRVRRLNFPNEWSEDHQALFALLHKAAQ
jgi:hypothetical protein